MAHDVGGWERALSVGQWTASEWMTNALTWPGVVAKLAVLCGLGVDYGYVEEKDGGRKAKRGGGGGTAMYGLEGWAF